jgi:DNA polymerase III sliding clamp (beta) subunit (PCNA family)
VKLDLDNIDTSGIKEVAIPAKIFSEVVGSLSNQQLIIDIKEDYSIEIKADSGVYNLVGESAETYPAEITLENAEKSVSLQSKSKSMDATSEMLEKLRAENEKLRRNLEFERLRVRAYERLIEIVKEEDGIDVLKKDGAKQ